MKIKKVYNQRKRTRTIRAIAGELYRSAKSRSKKYNGTLSITKEWIVESLLKGKCEITGLPFQFNTNGTRQGGPYTPSLDRIDSSNRDQSPQNTQVVLLQVNCTKSNFDDATHLQILRVLVPKLEEMVRTLNSEETTVKPEESIAT